MSSIKRSREPSTMPNPPAPRNFSGKTARQLGLWRSSTPPPPTEILSDGSVVERLAGKSRVDRIIQDADARSPAQPVTIAVNGESINLADPIRFPNASHDRTAWLKDIQAKIPPPETEIVQIRFVGEEDFGLFNENGEQVKWEDGHWWH